MFAGGDWRGQTCRAVDVNFLSIWEHFDDHAGELGVVGNSRLKQLLVKLRTDLYWFLLIQNMHMWKHFFGEAWSSWFVQAKISLSQELLRETSCHVTGLRCPMVSRYLRWWWRQSKFSKKWAVRAQESRNTVSSFFHYSLAALWCGMWFLFSLRLYLSILPILPFDLINFNGS